MAGIQIRFDGDQRGKQTKSRAQGLWLPGRAGQGQVGKPGARQGASAMRAQSQKGLGKSSQIIPNGVGRGMGKSFGAGARERRIDLTGQLLNV